jgi:capsular exopolysaccharide synthesis family protein
MRPPEPDQPISGEAYEGGNPQPKRGSNLQPVLASGLVSPALAGHAAYPVDYRAAAAMGALANPGGSDGGGGMDPMSLLMALRRRWFLALFLGLLTAGVAAWTVWTLWPPPGATAQTLLYVNSIQPVFDRPGLVPNIDFNIYRRTQQALIRSRPVIRAALKNPLVTELNMIKRLGDSAAGYLEVCLSADYSLAPEILTVYLGGTLEDVNELPILLDALIDAYFSEIVHSQHNSLRGRLKHYETNYENQEKEIASKRESLGVLATELGPPPDTHLIQIQTTFAREQLQAVERRREESEDKRGDKEVDMALKNEQLKDLAETIISQEEIDALVNKDPGTMELREQLQTTENDLEETLKAVGRDKNNTNYKRLKEDVDGMRSALEERYKEMRPAAQEQIRQEREGKLRQDIRDLEYEILLLKRREADYAKQELKLIDKTREVNLSSFAMEALHEEIKRGEENSAKLVEQIEAIKLELNAPDRINRLEKAIAGGSGITRKQTMVTWTAGLGAFGCVLFGVSLWEWRNRKINTLDEIVRGLGIRVVGALPALSDRRSAGSDGARDAFYPNYLIESVDTTRTMLLHAARIESLRTVMVTSAKSGEGKTSLSIQLAASLARAGRKTLFIDGDLRNPAAHAIFNLPLGPGLSELLRGEVEIAGTVQPTSVRGLWMIPAGKWNAQATEALAQEGARALLDQLKNEFDFVIVDSSPVLAVVDALLFGQQVDAAIFSILHDVSHSPSVYAAHQRLEALGVRILGAVVNGVAGEQYAPQMDYAYGNYAGRVNQPV